MMLSSSLGLHRKAIVAALVWVYGATIIPAGLAQSKSGPAGEPPPESQPMEIHRVLDIVPVADALPTSHRFAPLSAGQKFELFARTTFDPGTAAVGVVGAALSASANAQPSYGGGAAAFAQKAGAVAADYASSNLFSRAVLPSLLHQDPRFFRKEGGSVRSRLFYAVSRTFVARSDSGHNVVNASFLGGDAMTVALSNVYYPNRNRNAPDAARRFGYSIGIDAMVNVVREFWKRQD